MATPTFDTRRMTRRDYLLVEALIAGTSVLLAREAVATTALEHPELDMDGDRRTFSEWREMQR